MSRTQKFREQHRELEAIVGQIGPMLRPDAVTTAGDQMRALLVVLAGKLNTHLAMEDNALYPTLMNHPNQEIQKKASAFMKEMGSIKQVFTSYMSRYPTGRSIQSSPGTFIEDTKGLIKVLAKRIKAEDKDLYELADRLG